MIKTFRAIFFAILTVAPFAAATGADSPAYPARPVTMIVPWPAGGGTDVIARAFADVARQHFTQPIVIVNKPGAIGTIGVAEAAAGEPDGYKILMATPEVVIASHLGIAKARYDDFVPVARLNADPAAITVKADSPWKTIEQFLAFVRSNPGKVALSTSGNGAIPDLAAVALEDEAGLKFLRVPYQGESPAIQAAIAGHVDATMVAPGALSAHVAAGRLRILVVTSLQRTAEYPGVPTLKEKGIDVSIGTWRGLLLPKGVPPEVVSQWRELTRKVSADAKFREVLRIQNISTMHEEADVFAAVLKQDNDLFKKLVPKLDIKNK